MEETPMMKRKKVLYTAAPVLAVALLFSFFMDWLYDNDNKYTYKGAQAFPVYWS